MYQAFAESKDLLALALCIPHLSDGNVEWWMGRLKPREQAKVVDMYPGKRLIIAGVNVMHQWFTGYTWRWLPRPDALG